MAVKVKRSTKKQKKNIVSGVVHINSTFNNTIITITDLSGNTISWSSAGSVGFKGAEKGHLSRLRRLLKQLRRPQWRKAYVRSKF